MVLARFHFKKTYIIVYQPYKTPIKIPSKQTVTGSNPVAITDE